jgi:hypothetical protein
MNQCVSTILVINNTFGFVLC